jgi:hypothetical protein
VDSSQTDLICFLGDDSVPMKNFLLRALEDMSAFEGGWGLVAFNDKTGRDLPTHWLGHKKLLPLIGGEFFHAGYHHCFCDNELRFRVEKLGRYKFSVRAIVLHNHPLMTMEANWDDFYASVYSKEVFGEDLQLFQNRCGGAGPANGLDV